MNQTLGQSLCDFDVVAELRALRVPAMLVHGRQDPIPLASSETVAKALGANMLVLEDCGHVPYVERAAGLFPPLLAFLTPPDGAPPDFQ